MWPPCSIWHSPGTLPCRGGREAGISSWLGDSPPRQGARPGVKCIVFRRHSQVTGWPAACRGSTPPVRALLSFVRPASPAPPPSLPDSLFRMLRAPQIYEGSTAGLLASLAQHLASSVSNYKNVRLLLLRFSSLWHFHVRSHFLYCTFFVAIQKSCHTICQRF